MLKQLRTSVAMLLVMTLLTGVAYPLAVTLIARAAFPRQATGSMILVDGQPVGSELIGQSFALPEHFWGRPSATSGHAYNAVASGGSNLGPRNPELRATVAQRVANLRNGDASARRIPIDLVTASASGLDPHISPAAAEFQVERVAAARGVSAAAVREIVRRLSEGRQGGLWGEPRVNVLRLNLTLDRELPGVRRVRALHETSK